MRLEGTGTPLAFHLKHLATQCIEGHCLEDTSVNLVSRKEGKNPEGGEREGTGRAGSHLSQHSGLNVPRPEC